MEEQLVLEYLQQISTTPAQIEALIEIWKQDHTTPPSSPNLYAN